MNTFSFGFSAGDGEGQDFDPTKAGEILSQLGNMLSGLGGAISADSSEENSGPVNYTVANKLAKEAIGKPSTISDQEKQAVTSAVQLAQTWLESATVFPSASSNAATWNEVQWLDESIDTWKQLCDPIASKMSGMWLSGLPEEQRESAGPLVSVFDRMGSLAFGTQLGQSLAKLAKEVLTSTDIGFPLGHKRDSVLLPNAINTLADDLSVPRQELLVFLAAREAAHQRLFAGANWLRGHVMLVIDQYARNMTIDRQAIEDTAQAIGPDALADPQRLQELLSSGVFETGPNAGQKEALEKLEVLLALIEGWVENTVRIALADRLPQAEAMIETLHRRRASGGPAEQAFSVLVGLQLRPRKLREATQFFARLTEAVGIEQRDHFWDHPDLLPSAADLDSNDAILDFILKESPSAKDTNFDSELSALLENSATENKPNKVNPANNAEADHSESKDTEADKKLGAEGGYSTQENLANDQDNNSPEEDNK